MGMRNARVWPLLPALVALVACASGAVQATSSAITPSEIVMRGDRLFPESITSDAGGDIYIGSNPGTVFRARLGESVAEPWLVPDAANGLQGVFGVLADDARGMLWVCSNPAMGQPGAPVIVTFRLDDGALVARYPFDTGQAPAMCNDMTIAANGDVYASEMLGGRIMRLRNGGTFFEVWADDPEFATIDGIAFAGDGTLFANTIQRNNLLRVNVDAYGNFAGATVLTPSRPMSAPDGLRLLEGNRFLQSEGNAGLITLVTVAGDRALIETLAEGIDYASSVTAAGGRAYFPEGKLRFLFGPLAGQDPGPFVVRSVAIPEAD